MNFAFSLPALLPEEGKDALFCPQKKRPLLERSLFLYQVVYYLDMGSFSGDLVFRLENQILSTLVVPSSASYSFR